MTQFTCKVSNRSITGYHLNTFTICLSQHFSSAWEFQMGNFQKYWSQNVGQDFIVLDILLGGGRAGGKGVCGRLMSPTHETQSMWEIRLLRRRLPRKGGGLTGMQFGSVVSEEKIKMWKLTTDGRDGKISHGLWLRAWLFNRLTRKIISLRLDFWRHFLLCISLRYRVANFFWSLISKTKRILGKQW